MVSVYHVYQNSFCRRKLKTNAGVDLIDFVYHVYHVTTFFRTIYTQTIYVNLSRNTLIILNILDIKILIYIT